MNKYDAEKLEKLHKKVSHSILERPKEIMAKLSPKKEKEKKKEIEFLKEYKKLCFLHGFEIVGCGECGSAWLQELGEEEIKNNTLVWREGFQEIRFADDYDLDNETNNHLEIKGKL